MDHDVSFVGSPANSFIVTIRIFHQKKSIYIPGLFCVLARYSGKSDPTEARPREDGYTKFSCFLIYNFYRHFYFLPASLVLSVEEVLLVVWTSRGHRCRPFSPPVRASFWARIHTWYVGFFSINSHWLVEVHRMNMLPTNKPLSSRAFSATIQFLCKKKSSEVYTKLFLVSFRTTYQTTGDASTTHTCTHCW